MPDRDTRQVREGSARFSMRRSPGAELSRKNCGNTCGNVLRITLRHASTGYLASTFTPSLRAPQNPSKIRAYTAQTQEAQNHHANAQGQQQAESQETAQKARKENYAIIGESHSVVIRADRSNRRRGGSDRCERGTLPYVRRIGANKNHAVPIAESRKVLTEPGHSAN